MKVSNLIVAGVSLVLIVGLNSVTAWGQASFDDNLMNRGNMPTLENNQGAEGIRDQQGMMQRRGGQGRGPGMMQRRGGQGRGPGMMQRGGGRRR